MKGFVSATMQATKTIQQQKEGEEERKERQGEKKKFQRDLNWFYFWNMVSMVFLDTRAARTHIPILMLSPKYLNR